MRVATGLVLLGLGAATPALAQPEPGDVRAGQRLATTWCANCHQIAVGGPGSANDAAPPFPAVAQMVSTTSMSLRVFLQSPHGNMPDYRLSREQIDDVVAYILSLRR
ncbi:c-type cytochrome [Neoroseomonas oryzicola]|uniref:Cytochrome c n=1 Tax=Neoroseomonas oryzicola TaxID=535904 RepID=A0A9X9WMF2_9PROT|nr:cytochrome c [Neoroseomonas oryzicola]MBR0661512.1 cytochrome c [Neoroseomonas oryzicola]NKE19076.1 cytochrome c [Neoroseomonas oryzicola]